MIGDLSTSKVTVKKDELLSTIRANREKHAHEHAEALEGFKSKVIEMLEKRLAKAKEGTEEDLQLYLIRPPNHTKDYDRVIKMLEMSTSDEIVITEKQFSHYVLDEWQWMEEFKTQTAAYGRK